MKMTAEEITRRYNENPTRETMGQIAAENECSIQEIGEFLKNAAEKKKPGRPKKMDVIVPLSVIQFVNTRITQLTEVMESTKEELSKMEQELSELKAYMESIKGEN